MAVEVFANDAVATVTSGGTTAPSAGTGETWMLSSSTFPAVSSSATPPTQCYVADTASGAETEKVLITNISGSTATVTRGADGTTPVIHASGFTIAQVLTRASLQGLQEPGWYNIGAYGGTGTNTSADTTLIQALINAAPAGSTIFFDKLYTVSTLIQLAGGLTYQGINQATGLQMANSSNLAALAAPVGWAANTATQASAPVTIRDMYFGGPPSVTQASGTGHLLVMNNYWSYVEDCTFGYNIGQGVRMDACTANGTQIISGGGAVQNRFHRCQFYQNNGGSLASNDPSGAFTDGYIVDCIFEAGTGVNPAIGMGTFAGWKIDGNHYFGYDGSVIVGRPYETRVVNNYFETWGDSATSDFYIAVDFGSVFVADGGAGSVVSGNTFNLGNAGNAGSTLIAVAFAAATGQQGTVAITGNQFSGPSGTVTGTMYGITLNGQTSTSTVVATVSGNSFSGTWNGAQVSLSNEDSSAITNFTVNGFNGGTAVGIVAPAVTALAFGTSIAVDAAFGNAFNLTLTASTGTIANPTNPTEAQIIRFRIKQDGTGSRTVAWGTGYDFGAAGAAPTLSTGANKLDIIAFEYDAGISKWCCLNSGGLGY